MLLDRSLTQSVRWMSQQKPTSASQAQGFTLYCQTTTGKVISPLLWFCIATVCVWLKNLAPLSRPIRSKTKTNRDLPARVSRAWRPRHVFASRSDWFIALSGPVLLWICSDKGLTLETSAFQSLYGSEFTLSTPLINQIFVFHSPTDAAPQFLQKLTPFFDWSE